MLTLGNILDDFKYNAGLLKYAHFSSSLSAHSQTFFIPDYPTKIILVEERYRFIVEHMSKISFVSLSLESGHTEHFV